MRERLELRVVEPVFQHRHQRLVDERGLAASAHSADSHEASEREVHIYILEVVASRPTDSDGEPVSRSSCRRNFYLPPACQVIEGD